MPIRIFLSYSSHSRWLRIHRCATDNGTGRQVVVNPIYPTPIFAKRHANAKTQLIGDDRAAEGDADIIVLATMLDLSKFRSCISGVVREAGFRSYEANRAPLRSGTEQRALGTLQNFD